MKTKFTCALSAALTAATLAVWPATGQAWKPTKTVEFIVPAGIGGGAGQMAQLIQGIVTKHKLMPTSMVVISKKGGSGAEGF
ncbi:MAG: tripartite tricarboxylate transporter substrate binding protein, partial [Burkholderiales bacterium]